MVGGREEQLPASMKSTELDRPTQVGIEPIPTSEKSKLSAKVMRVFKERLALGDRSQAPRGPEDFVVSVEVNPSPGLSIDKALKATRMLREGHVDVVNIADGPRASVRMSNTALALRLREETGTECILHVCCRDRNILGLQSDILGCQVLGLHNLVIITGDPPKLGDYPKATAVFDLDSVELLKLVDGLNRGIDPTGKMVGEATSLFLSTGAEPGAFDYDRELKRLEMKIRAGAEMVMTQPVYDPHVVERFLSDVRQFRVPVLLGVCPLVSSRNAEFLHNEVPGMSVPPAIRDRMASAGGGPDGIAEGIAIAREMVTMFADRVVGVYVMPQLGRYGSALEVLKPQGYGLSEG
jgi:homocysteine S-methyltransferase